MADPFDNPGDDDLAMPPRLRQAIGELYTRRVSVPPEIDRAILAEARRGYLRRQWGWRIGPRVGLAAAVAAVLLLALHLGMPGTSPGPVAAPSGSPAALGIVGDVNHDGKIDVLDAFLVARAIRNGSQKIDPSWDVNGDGRVDEKDVQWIAQTAVRLGEGNLQ